MNRSPVARSAIALGFVLALVAPARAQDRATREQAVAMVKKGVAAIRADGAERTYQRFTDRSDPTFRDRDLYLVVYGLDGVVRAHGANGRMVGKNLVGLKGIDGRQFVRERIELARVQDAFWQDYKFTNPVSRQIRPKQMYCERVEQSVVCGGIYK